MIEYKFASRSHIEDIISILRQNNLPVDDIGKSPIKFIVAFSDEKLIGCIGIEVYDTEGLVRSFAVDPRFRNRGIGGKLYHKLLDYSCQINVRRLHLLTDTAKEYFSKVGFVKANRDNAPKEICKSAEFACLCPSSSTYMVLENVLNQA